MFGFVQAMFTVDCSTRCDGGSFFLREPNNFLSGFRRASGRDLMNSLPEILALITEAGAERGKGKTTRDERRSVFVN